MENKQDTRALLDEAAKRYYFWVTSVVSVVMGLATTGTMAAGLASENMTWLLIGVLWAGIVTYIVVLKFAFYLIALPVIFIALYYSREINSYCCTNNTDKSVFINIFFVVFIIGLIVSAFGLISVLASFIKKNTSLEKVSKIIINITMIYMLVFMAITVFTIKTDFVGANYPDISYIIFTFVLIFISFFIGININNKNKKTD